MRTIPWLAVALLSVFPGSELRAAQRDYRGRAGLEKLNTSLHGYVVDYTSNHGKDNRRYSPALHQKRDLYVYLPPGFDPQRRYPVLLWLHGFAQDEVSFLTDVVGPLDEAMTSGKLPPTIVAAPDGSLTGRDSWCYPGSFFLNTQAGRFEDFLMKEVWPFVLGNYPILPERQAHVIAGASMGGGAAFNKAIKYRDQFAVVAGIFPAVNLRWEDCHGRYKGKFDPCCWGWRTDYTRRFEVIARYFGFFVIYQGQILAPLLGRNNEENVAFISRENPIEMLDAYGVRPGELAMYVAYAGQDEFNIDSQVESFLYRTRQRCLEVHAAYSPQGHHDRATAMTFFPSILDWLEQQLGPYKCLARP